MTPRRHGLTDAEWEVLRPLLPPHKRMGRPPSDDRLMLEGILWRTRTGAPWRDLPARFGPWQTVYTRFNEWSRHGVWQHIVTALRSQLRARGGLSQTWYIDGTIIRATRAASGGGKKGVWTSPPTMRSASRGAD